MGLNDNCIKLTLKYFVCVFFFYKQSKLNTSYVVLFSGVYGYWGDRSCITGFWRAQLWLCTVCYTVFNTLTGWRFQSISVCYICHFFIVWTVWLKLLTLWMLTVETLSFFISLIRVPHVGV